MKRNRLVTVLTLVLAACTTEVGGGGVNIEEPVVTSTGSGSTTTSVSSTTTTTAVPSTTTTTLPVFIVSGQVTDPDGEPVARATVTMEDESVITGPDGSFLLETTSPAAMTVTKNGWTTIEIPFDEDAVAHNAEISLEKVRGVRVSADAAGDDSFFALLLTLAENTAINALVFDTKQEGGLVPYDSTVEEAREAGAVKAVYDPAARVAEAHEAGLYTITRVVTFEDELRTRAFPAEKLAGVWLNPTVESARQYNLDLAVEACGLGFDEIQFDYVRYPAGRTATVSGQLDLTQEERLAAISGFLAEAKDALQPLGCSVSAAIFGIVVSSPNDQGLGQRPEEVSAETDVVSPMVYPSHYSSGWLGFDDPNDHPYDVTDDAINDALPRMADRSQLRPWLQAFWWTNDQIRRAIQAAEDNDVGWILWNVRSNFDPEAIPTDEELEAGS